MMMVRISRIIAGVFLLAMVGGCQLWRPSLYEPLAEEPAAKHVLMIGNSLTYTNDLPGLLERLSAGEPAHLKVESVTAPLESLEGHWRGGRARRAIEKRRWDFVVLQEYSVRPATNPERTVADMTRFATLARAQGAQVVIFQNWLRRGRQADAPRMAQTYQRVAAATGGVVAPVGEAWHRCRERHPEVKLLADDRHPTVAGTYLAACVLYRTLYGKPASGLPADLPGLTLPKATAATLQAVADGR